MGFFCEFLKSQRSVSMRGGETNVFSLFPSCTWIPSVDTWMVVDPEWISTRWKLHIRNFDGRPECGTNDRKTPPRFAMVPFPCEWCTKINQYMLSRRIPIYPSFQLWRWVKIASQKRDFKTRCEDDQRIRGFLGVRFGQKHGCSFLFN